MHSTDILYRLTSLSLRQLLRELRHLYLAVAHTDYPENAHYHRNETLYNAVYFELQRRGVDVEGYIRRSNLKEVIR